MSDKPKKPHKRLFDIAAFKEHLAYKHGIHVFRFEKSPKSNSTYFTAIYGQWDDIGCEVSDHIAWGHIKNFGAVDIIFDEMPESQRLEGDYWKPVRGVTWNKPELWDQVAEKIKAWVADHDE